jgi:hypothetical protein
MCQDSLEPLKSNQSLQSLGVCLFGVFVFFWKKRKEYQSRQGI